MSLRSRDTDALLAVLADPKLHQQRLTELRDAEQQLAAKTAQFEEREQALASREREAEGVLESRSAINAQQDRAAATLKTREQACESHESAVLQKERALEECAHALDISFKENAKNVAVLNELMAENQRLEIDLREKLDKVEHERAVLANKREQVLKIMS